MEDFTLQLRCNVCDSVLVAHWRVDTAGVFAHVDPCAKCNAAQPTLAPDALRVCGKCGLSEQNHADSLCNPNYSAGKA